MKLPVRKLRSNTGETLLETLASVLIVGLSCAIFAVMTLSGAKMNSSVKAVDDARYAQLTDAETHAGGTSGSVIISWNGSSQDFPVVYTGTGQELSSYEAGGSAG